MGWLQTLHLAKSPGGGVASSSQVCEGGYWLVGVRKEDEEVELNIVRTGQPPR